MNAALFTVLPPSPAMETENTEFLLGFFLKWQDGIRALQSITEFMSQHKIPTMQKLSFPLLILVHTG